MNIVLAELTSKLSPEKADLALRLTLDHWNWNKLKIFQSGNWSPLDQHAKHCNTRAIVIWTVLSSKSFSSFYLKLSSVERATKRELQNNAAFS